MDILHFAQNFFVIMKANAMGFHIDFACSGAQNWFSWC